MNSSKWSIPGCVLAVTGLVAVLAATWHFSDSNVGAYILGLASMLIWLVPDSLLYRRRRRQA